MVSLQQGRVMTKKKKEKKKPSNFLAQTFSPDLALRENCLYFDMFRIRFIDSF